MKPNIKLVKDERLIYRYNNVKGLVNLHYNTVIITNLRLIMVYAYKPWWYYWLFIIKPNEISNTTIFIKYISSIKIKTRPIFTSSFLGPFSFAKKNNNNNENEHSTTSNNYYPQRYSLEDIIFKAFLRGLFFGCIFSALLWKFFNNIPIKFLIAQCLLCILFNVFYDFKSYSPVKYLEIYTLDGIGDDDDVIIDNNQKRRMRRKMHTNCNVYYGSSNSYIIEGELDELKFLRDKITSAIKGCTIAKEMSDEEIFKNDKLKIDKRNKNLNIMRRNQDSLLKDDLTNRKKVKKRSLNGKNRNIEFEKENNIFVKDKSLNIMNRKSNFKNKIKRTIESKKKSIKNNQENNDNVNKKSLIRSLFRFIFNFIKFVIISYLSVVLILSLIYHTTKHLEQMNI